MVFIDTYGLNQGFVKNTDNYVKMKRNRIYKIYNSKFDMSDYQTSIDVKCFQHCVYVQMF